MTDKAESSSGLGNLERAVDRLAAPHRKGSRAGRKWAKSGAKASQLRSLERHSLSEGFRNWTYQVTTWTERTGDGIAASLFKVLNPRHEATQVDVEEFWLDALIGSMEEDEDAGDLIEEEDFARGFIEGALQVWHAVKDKI